MKTILRSTGFSCPSCVSKIEKALQRTDGVQAATVHFNTGRIEVEHDPERARPDELASVVDGLGYITRVSPF